MDLEKALRELYSEKKRIDRAIARLESRLATMSGTPSRSRRGRHAMGADERLQVSARMTAYWAARRAKVEASKATAETGQGSQPVGNGIGRSG